ncbi:MAG: leucine-rich repeat domain-containing protein, partial [Clostridiales bacterium]|nr:leucine-rich repeat domain-containing protein [Clostridiales bacterium]
MNGKFKKFLVLIPIGVAALGLAACGDEPTPGPGPGPDDTNHTHTYATVWSHDKESHWHSATCDHSAEVKDKAEHSFTVNAEKSTVSCTDDGVVVYECECGYSYQEIEEAWGHTLETLDAKAPTCTEEGVTAGEVCTREGCGYKKGAEVIPATGHSYSSAWEWNDAEHWHVATCGHELEKDSVGLHDYSTSSVCVCGRPYEADSENFTYVRDGNGYVITGLSEAAQNVTVLSFPATYKNLDISAIAEFAFENNTTITNVIIPAGVATIGKEAFRGCTSLESVQIGEGLTTIENAAFSGCTSLEGIRIPASVTTINSYAFEKCAAMETVEMLPASLSLLGEQVFSGCSSLVSIRIPTLLPHMVVINDKGDQQDINYKLGNNMFLNCTSLETVTFGAGVKAIGTLAFGNCTSLTSITLPSTVEFIGNNAFKNSGLTTIVLPDAVTYVGAYAFKDCTSLTSATIKSGVTYAMGDWFSGCSALESLTVPFVGSRMDSELAVSTHFGYLFGTTAPKAADAEKFEAVQVTPGEGASAKTHTYYIPKTLTDVTILGG